jgi:hypothetical protein
MQLQIGDHARLNGELVEIVDFRRCPTVKDGGGVAYIPGVSVRWLSTGTVSYTQGAVYTAELRDLLPKEPGQP